jgi:hypothetical protein
MRISDRHNGFVGSANLGKQFVQTRLLFLFNALKPSVRCEAVRHPISRTARSPVEAATPESFSTILGATEVGMRDA